MKVAVGLSLFYLIQLEKPESRLKVIKLVGRRVYY